MSSDSPFQAQPAYVEKTSHKKRWIVIFFVVLILIIIGLGALYLLGGSVKHTSLPTNPIPTETMSASPTSQASTSAQLGTTPTASPTAAVKPTSLSVAVLNGSGIPGAAGKIANALTSAGFTDVTTGNAKAYTYTGVTVYAKNNADLQQVQKVITAADSSVKVSASVDSTIPTDVEVIVGK